MNAFTQKPDLSTFIKKARVSENVAKLGRAAREKPTKHQKMLFNMSPTAVQERATRKVGK